MTALELIAKEKKEKTGKLDIGKCGLTELPEELFELEWLEELFISNRISDLKKGNWIESENQGSSNRLKKLSPFIGKLKNLKKLYISGDWESIWKISDISFWRSLRDFSL